MPSVVLLVIMSVLLLVPNRTEATCIPQGPQSIEHQRLGYIYETMEYWFDPSFDKAEPFVKVPRMKMFFMDALTYAAYGLDMTRAFASGINSEGRKILHSARRRSISRTTHPRVTSARVTRDL
jgi:hypothetical protein